jgi:ribose transport system permease protein
MASVAQGEAGATPQPGTETGPDPEHGPERANSGRSLRWVEAAALPILFIVIGVIFSIASPSSFLTVGNVSSVLGTNTVLVGVMAAALIPLIVGEFDLSVGAVTGLAGMIVAVLNGEHHMEVLLACLIAVLAALACGAINALFVVALDNNSFIVTLGVGTAATGVVYWMSGSETVSGTSAALSNGIYDTTLLGIPVEFYYGLILILILWYVLEMTPLGQRVTFVGQSRSVARLSGIRVDRTRAGAFLAAGVIAGLAGVVSVATSGAADPASGPDLLLPALAAAFLGSTTFRPGRLNMIGALIAVYFLAMGVDGLELLGVQDWVQDVFYGGALVLAVAITRLLKRRVRS